MYSNSDKFSEGKSRQARLPEHVQAPLLLLSQRAISVPPTDVTAPIDQLVMPVLLLLLNVAESGHRVAYSCSDGWAVLTYWRAVRRVGGVGC